MNCTHALSNLTAGITVQRTVGADFAKQYSNFYPGTAYQNHEETATQLFYTWHIKRGQIIGANEAQFYVEAQFQLKGVNQTVGDDIYFVSVRSACNNQEITRFGHF